MCVITISDVCGIGPEPTFIRVMGTVVDCNADLEGDRVVVSISCTSLDEPFAVDAADVDGDNWVIVFDVPADAGCECGEEGNGKPVFVKAWCASDDSCVAPDFPVPSLRCCPECPEVGTITPEPGEELVRCNSDGSASVTLRALIDNSTPGDIRAFIECGTNPPGQLEAPDNFVELMPGQIGTVEATCNYDTPSTPQPFVRFTDLNGVDLGCPEVPLQVGLVDCPCPEVVNLDVSVIGCTATFEGTLSPDIEGCTYIWDFGDGSGDVETSEPTVTHEYPCAKTYAAVVTMKCGDDCSETTTKVVMVEDCRSCGACCLPDGSCEELTEEECRNRDGEYMGDGSSCEDVECEVVDEDGDGENGGFDWPDFLCKFLLPFAKWALFIAVFFALVAGCAGLNTPPGWFSFIGSISMFALALTALLLWWGLCGDSDCAPLNALITALSYMVIISAFLSLILISLGNPCGFGAALGTVQIGLLLGLAVWIGNKTGCYGALDND